MESTRLKDIKILLVNDDEDDYRAIKALLDKVPHSPFILEWTPSYSGAKQMIDRDDHDIYMIDYHLGNNGGLDLLRFANASRRSQPFILTTDAEDSSIEWRSMELAAADYLVKGKFDSITLSRALNHALQRKKIEEQRVRQLVEVNRAKDEFISIASHQLRTPATAVKQYVGMVLEGFVGDISEDQTDLLRKAYDNNERQLRIVSDLLRVAQVDAGHIKLRHDTVDISLLLYEVCKDLQAVLRDRLQTIEFAGKDDGVTIEGDRDSLRMVLDNMLDNASKYSESETKVQIVVDETDDRVEIHIADQGVGIDPAQSSRLFEKFSRLDNPLSNQVSGTGLGLYWAKKIVNLHQGEISYTGNTKRGTIFTISLPKSVSVTNITSR